MHSANSDTPSCLISLEPPKQYHLVLTPEPRLLHHFDIIQYHFRFLVKFGVLYTTTSIFRLFGRVVGKRK
ncbi:hypothetical protein HBI38_072980 [Parastagonospora nodorum]|nr:hypothetical protein HBI73_041080 [Parastagonospora nodorum]KAH5436237.1 hypothetical protein HBI47_076730 [Parastagonospora nodorum]KAH5656603.1 hypothetical protein HBI23_147050 [Parastagonospora nodorum]KAH6273800.1 hypothetical protein HBI41_074210 [Parastagonospora nodorum]KAH6294413.1 hypothetical protein HBI40_065300 [Parastagonospora nodorum]